MCFFCSRSQQLLDWLYSRFFYTHTIMYPAYLRRFQGTTPSVYSLDLITMTLQPTEITLLFSLAMYKKIRWVRHFAFPNIRLCEREKMQIARVVVRYSRMVFLV